MADDLNTQNPGATPPKQSPFKTVTPAGAAAGAPKTIILRKPTLRRPGEAPTVAVPAAPGSAQPVAVAPEAKPLSSTALVAQGIAIPHAEAVKKMTSRINVSSATSPIPAVGPAAAPILSASPAQSAETIQTAKKMTSRITLESAFATQPEVSPAQSKTIRLKRPSEVVPPAPTAPASMVAPVAPGGEEPAPAAGGESPTRRKTIKVKRPGAASGPKITLNRPEGDAAGGDDDNLQSLSGFAAASRPAAGSDKVNPAFIVAAALAILAGSLLVWTLSSQAFGQRGAAGDFAFPKGANVPPPPGLATFD